MTRFDAFSYLWPPRPEKAVPPELLGFYEKRGWVAQHKLNGTCSVIAVSPERVLLPMNRHGQQHKLWQPTEASSRAFKALPGKGWWVFVAELMHSKVPGIKDTNYVHDVLVANGVHIVDKTMAERQSILDEVFPSRGDADSHYVIDDNTWRAKNHTAAFRRLFAGLERPEHEGIVVKNPRATLAPCFRDGVNAGWQVKCRKPHKNYSE